MTTIIYCSSYERGEEQFDKLMNQLQESGVNLSITKRKCGSFAKDINGNFWKVVSACDGARGHKWHTCYVDEEISLCVFHTIIKPSEVPRFLSPIGEREVYFY